MIGLLYLAQAGPQDSSASASQEQGQQVCIITPDSSQLTEDTKAENTPSRQLPKGKNSERRWRK